MNFYTSDLHLFHKMLSAERGFSSPEEMNEHIKSEINRLVLPEDNLYILGDFSFGNHELTIKWIDELNCKNLFLIRGNHDNEKIIKKYEHCFKWIKDYYIQKIKSEDQVHPNHLVMFHYPMITWDRGHYGAWHLHGHCHGSLKIFDNSTRMDVGWDVYKRILSFEDIKRYMSNRVYKVYDHHE